MKTWSILLALAVAGTCIAQLADQLAAAKPGHSADGAGVERSSTDTLAMEHGIGLKELVQGNFLAKRYELVATLSIRNHCVAIEAGGEAGTIVDNVDIRWCPDHGASGSSQPQSQPSALAHIEVTTQLPQRSSAPAIGRPAIERC